MKRRPVNSLCRRVNAGEISGSRHCRAAVGVANSRGQGADWGPRSRSSASRAELLKSKAPVQARKHVNAAVVLGVFDALHHNP